MVGDHSGWIAVLEVPGIPQIWVEEWIGKSATITKIPDLDGFGREPRGECLRPIWGSFLHPIGSTWATETPWQVSDQNLDSQPSGEVQIPRGVDRKTR